MIGFKKYIKELQSVSIDEKFFVVQALAPRIRFPLSKFALEPKMKQELHKVTPSVSQSCTMLLLSSISPCETLCFDFEKHCDT